MQKILWVFLCLIFLQESVCLYCEPDNCYNLLEVSPSSSQEEIRKAFRTMARRHHPDKNQLEDTTALFQQINIAYEILENENTRRAYDAFLRDPSGSRAYHTYQYYRASYSPQVHPLVAIGGVLALLSWLQWVMRNQMHRSAIESITNSEEFKIKVNEQLESEGRKGDKWYKEEVAERLKEEISIEGGYSKPKIQDILFLRALLLPFTLLWGIWRTFRWIGKYYILRHDYDEKDQNEMTRTTLKITKAQWEAYPEKDKQELIKRRLWEKNNMMKYNEEMKQQWLDNLKKTNPAKYKKIMIHLRKTQ